MKAKKSYGQHFLTSEQIASRIADSLAEGRENYERVLEVGPGKAMLTKFLLDKDYRLRAVEADRDMVNYLQKAYPQLDTIQADFLKLDLSSVFEGEEFGLIGNFPYNISSQILFRMIRYREYIPELVGMFQKEMAKRVVAGPGGKEYGRISVLVQAYYEGEYLFGVSKNNFSPPPAVQSAVIRLRRKPAVNLDCDEKLFSLVVKQTFGQRRKMLRNTLKSLLPPKHSLLKEDLFRKRPEKLSVEEFVHLTKRVEEIRKNNK